MKIGLMGIDQRFTIDLCCQLLDASVQEWQCSPSQFFDHSVEQTIAENDWSCKLLWRYLTISDYAACHGYKEFRSCQITIRDLQTGEGRRLKEERWNTHSMISDWKIQDEFPILTQLILEVTEENLNRVQVVKMSTVDGNVKLLTHRRFSLDDAEDIGESLRPVETGGE
ncbi:MAG: hypothetical protein JWM11_7408 [Planctomycetaceae bacterium]|nr:hypothetical protein [Planctomycetaceae bacterium]